MARTKASVPEVAGLPDRYVLRRYIAQTLHGDVIEAENRDRATKVALKLLNAEGSHEGIARAMFHREVEALRGLDHPAIVHIIDSFECGESLLAIELELIVGGQNLAHLFEEARIGKLSPPPLEWRIRMAGLLAEAVIAAHRRDVIHRDIKPRNVLWDRYNETLKLADFGIAAVVPLTVREPDAMTLRSFYTRPFASPEQLLQKAPSVASDVYGFGLLVASLIALKEPDASFEPKDLSELITDSIGELRQEGVSAFDVEQLEDALMRALHDGPSERPSMTEFNVILSRVAAALVPRPVASFALTRTARTRLEAAGFSSEADILDDFNSDLRVQFDRHGDDERIRIFGQSLFAVLIAPDGLHEAEPDLLAIDAGQNPGPRHASHCRFAEPCSVRLKLSPSSVSGEKLVNFALEADREATRRVTAEIIERARLIVDIERERLPVFMMDAVVEGGRSVPGREALIAQASGFDAAQVERVFVSGGFRLQVRNVRAVPNSVMKKATVRSKLEQRGVTFDDSDPTLLDTCHVDDWHTLFDELESVNVLDEHGHIIGTITRYDERKQEVHVQTSRRWTLLRAGTFYIKDQQKERQLRQQELAIASLERGETARADMARILSEAAAHQMGEKPWVELIQNGLTPEHRVKDLVNRILASESAFCLQGPPGTGKTTIIAEVVAQLLTLDPTARILICAQANDAVANAIERVLKLRDQLDASWIIVRDVRPERARIEGEWAGYDAAYSDFCERLREGIETATMPAEAKPIAAEWLGRAEHRNADVERDYHGLVQVWGTTTARSKRPLAKLDDGFYDLVVIDEAAKATVGEVMIPIVHARRLLLVGDQKQLPPYLEDTTQEALEELGVSEEQAKYSLFEHLMALLPRDHRDMLDTQFRMHPSIGNVVSRLFYGSQVRNGPGTENRPLPRGLFDREHRVMWVDVVGSDYKVLETSRANDLERETTYTLLDRLSRDAAAVSMKLEVAVIAAYRGQAEKFASEIGESERRWPNLDIKAATVDAFQGREADVVIYSLVRTGDAERKFLADGRRFNVALSRAKRLLLMVGDKRGARGTEMLQMLLEMIPEDNQLSGHELSASLSGEK